MRWPFSWSRPVVRIAWYRDPIVEALRASAASVSAAARHFQCNALDRLRVASLEAHHDRFRRHVTLARRGEGAVQSNLELVDLVQDAEVLQVLSCH